MNEFDKTAWIAQAKQLLDDSARDLDAATASRLNRARQAALTQRANRALRQWWLPAGLASACALLLAVAVWRPHGAPTSAGATSAPIATPALGAGDNAAAADSEPADDSLEFYQDLEFYAWLDAQGKDSDG